VSSKTKHISKKVCFFANDGWSIFNYRLGLINHLKSKGYSIYLICPKDKYTEKLEELGFSHNDVTLRHKSQNFLYDLIYLASIFFLLKRIKPDIGLTFNLKQNIFASIVLRVLSIPTISNITGLGTFMERSLTRIVVFTLLKLSIKNNYCTFFQNTLDKDLFLRRKIINKSKSELIPGSGIDLNSFKYVEKSCSLKTNFLFISRISKNKGIEHVINAAKYFYDKNKDINFYICGHIEEKKYSVKMFNDLSKKFNIYYLGFKEDVREEYVKCDCVIFPSEYFEGTPKALIETGATGRLAIASDLRGCNEIIRHKINGFLFNPSIQESFFDSINAFMSLTREDRLKMELDARKIVEKKYDERIIFKKYLSKIEGLGGKI